MKTDLKFAPSGFSPESRKLLDGMKLAVAKVYAEARRDDAQVVIMRDGKVVWVKARELFNEQLTVNN